MIYIYIYIYIEAGPEEDPILSKWVKARVLQQLPDIAVTHSVVDFTNIESIEEMLHLVNLLLHDRRTGMLRGQPGPMQYLIETEPTDSPTKKTKTAEQQTIKTFNARNGTADIQTQMDGNQRNFDGDGAQFEGNLQAAVKDNGKRGAEVVAGIVASKAIDGTSVKNC